MSLIDAILIVIILLAFGWGGKLGFIKTIGDILGAIVGIIAASWFYIALGNVFGGGNFGIVMAFVIVFVLVNRIVFGIFFVLDKIYDFLTIIPLTKLVNSFAGSVCMAISFALCLGVALPVIGRLFSNPAIMDQINHSWMVSLLTQVASIVMPLLPNDVRQAILSLYLI